MRTSVSFLMLVSCAAHLALGQSARSPADNYSELVPQNLLRLVHAPEVHEELNFTSEQVARLEAFFDQFDGPWFRARVLAPEKQRAVIAEIEGKLRMWIANNASAEQRERLAQLEYRSLGIRMLLRNDLSEQLGLEQSQLQQLAELAKATNDATAALQQASMSNEVPEELKSAVAEANEAEQAALKSVLRSEQMQKLIRILGNPFDTLKLQRIYPLAPELVPVDHWINSQPIKLRELRGKVVVVHFYAFQCHNCHANFAHYNKWHDEFPKDEVVVIGIQTPETSREGDPDAVRTAAGERGFKFPVLIDLKSDNWKAWANTMWPTVYVIDKAGYIRYVWQGELNWNKAIQDQIIHDLIENLVAE